MNKINFIKIIKVTSVFILINILSEFVFSLSSVFLLYFLILLLAFLLYGYGFYLATKKDIYALKVYFYLIITFGVIKFLFLAL